MYSDSQKYFYRQGTFDTLYLKSDHNEEDPVDILVIRPPPSNSLLPSKRLHPPHDPPPIFPPPLRFIPPAFLL